MRQNWSRVKCAVLAALGVLGFSGAAVAAEAMITGNVPTVASSTASSTIVAPLWVYPSMPAYASYRAAPSAPRGPQVLIIREEPSLLTPADLHFSTDQEKGVTVVRGLLAR